MGGFAESQRLGEPSVCRAFITHKVESINYSALDLYASRVHPVYTNSAYPDQPDWRDQPGAERLARLFDHYKFSPATDYVVLSGDILRVAMVCALVGSLYKTVCFLRYDKQRVAYWPFHIDFNRGMSSYDQIDRDHPHR